MLSHATWSDLLKQQFVLSNNFLLAAPQTIYAIQQHGARGLSEGGCAFGHPHYSNEEASTEFMTLAQGQTADNGEARLGAHLC